MSTTLKIQDEVAVGAFLGQDPRRGWSTNQTLRGFVVLPVLGSNRDFSHISLSAVCSAKRTRDRTVWGVGESRQMEDGWHCMVHDTGHFSYSTTPKARDDAATGTDRPMLANEGQAEGVQPRPVRGLSVLPGSPFRVLSPFTKS